MTKPGSLTAVVALILAAPLAAAPPQSVDEALRELQAGAPRLEASRSRLTGLVTFLTAPPGTTLSPRALDGATAEERALSFLAGRGALFGLADPAADLRLDSQRSDEQGLTHVRFGQLYRGVPVTGGEMIVHLRGDQAVSVTARTWPVGPKVGTIPDVDAATATEAARTVLLKHLRVHDAELTTPRLEILNEGHLDGRAHPTRLAWFIEATRMDLREFIWIDAQKGNVILQFSQRPSAMNRQVHDANSTSSLPGPLARAEGGPATGDPDVDFAYNYSGDTYTYFLQQHGRDSYDGAGSVIRSTVDFCPTPADCPYDNAFWNGVQLVFGAGFSRADDVDAHELTHAVTDTSAGLFYYMQSGALNESFSDIFGETVDLVNLAGNDSAGVRWAMGEDVPGFGAIRNMMNPTLFNDPGKMTDPQFVCADPGGDAGGVHSNSGVPNHAYALMVDGGSYNGFTVNGIGLVKAGKIQYRALTTYLLSASDFLDNYNAVKQSCADLVGGVAGITSADCVEVAKALDAVQMPQTWPCLPTQPAVPALCPGGATPQFIYNDNFEGPAGFDNWTSTVLTGSDLWVASASFTTSGSQGLEGIDAPSPAHARANMVTGVTIPAEARLQFNHSFGFENDAGGTYDGGRILFSANGGGWTTAGFLISGGASYNGTIASGFGNPLAGNSAFVRDSYGYTATQLNLASLAGQNVRFGFDIGTDISFGDYGWYIDDVRIYTCPRAISIGDAAGIEGNVGTANVVFPVTLSAASPTTVTVNYTTTAQTATSGVDYTLTSGSLSFAPGVTTLPVPVPAIGDVLIEANETFLVTLSAPVNATIADGQAVGTIIDDDTPIADPATVYRLRHPTIGAYLFTVYPFERDSAQLQYGYIYEGVCCKWFISPGGDGRVPMHRLFSSGAGEYFFTIYDSERDAAVAQYGYVYEGVAAYAHPTSSAVAPRDWFRLRRGNKHIYTIYPSERDSAVLTYGYTYEGVSCFLPPP